MMICNFLFLVVMGPDLDLNEGLVEMVVIKRLWPYPEGIDLASGGFLEVLIVSITYLNRID